MLRSSRSVFHSLIAALTLGTAPAAAQGGGFDDGQTVEIVHSGSPDPDVAYASAADLYLSVWVQVKAGRSTNGDPAPVWYEIRAQRLDADGQEVDSEMRLFYADDEFVLSRPRVAYIAGSGQFLVTWEQSSNNGDVLGCAVDAATGTQSPVVTLAGTSDAEVQPCVGGEATTFGNDGVVVWFNDTDNHLMAAEVTAAGPGVAPSVVGLSLLFSGFALSPEISKSGDLAGRLLVVWGANVGFPRKEIWGRVIDRSAGVLTLPFVIHDDVDSRRPSVDGDGTSWVVAFERREPSGNGFDIAARPVRYDPVVGQAYFSRSEVTVSGVAGVAESNPAVAWIDGSAVVAWQQGAIHPQVHAKSIDPYRCTLCEGSFVLGDGVDAMHAPRLVAEVSGEAGSTSRKAMLVTVRDGDLGLRSCVSVHRDRRPRHRSRRWVWSGRRAASELRDRRQRRLRPAHDPHDSQPDRGADPRVRAHRPATDVGVLAGAGSRDRRHARQRNVHARQPAGRVGDPRRHQSERPGPLRAVGGDGRRRVRRARLLECTPGAGPLSARRSASSSAFPGLASGRRPRPIRDQFGLKCRCQRHFGAKWPRFLEFFAAAV